MFEHVLKIMRSCPCGRRHTLLTEECVVSPDAEREMRDYLGPEDIDLRMLTDSAIGKLEAMSDEEYAALDLTPDFDEEEENAE